VGRAAKQAVGPGGAVTETGEEVGAAGDDTGQAVGGVATGVGAGGGQAAGQVGQAVGQVGQAAEQVGQTAEDATKAAQDPGQPRRPAARRARDGTTKRGSKRGTRLSRSTEEVFGEGGRVVRQAAKVGHVAQQALGRLTGGGTGQAAEEATQQVGQAAEAAVHQTGQAATAALQQVAQAAAQATEQVGEAAVEASGKASFTPNSSDQAPQSGGQRRRPASGRSSDGETTRGSKRGRRRPRSSEDDGK
jgi:hypothetical protein